VFQHANFIFSASYYIVMCGLSGSTEFFPTLSHKRHDFRGKKIQHKMCMFSFIHNFWWRERNQQDATNPMFVIKLLSQHVSGIIMPIIRRTRPCTTAYGVLHWLCWLCLAVVVWRFVVSCVHCVKVTFTQCTQFMTQLHTTTASTTSAEHHMQ